MTATSRGRWRLRAARADDAESIAALHTSSWRRTYRGMMSDEFLDGPALGDRRRTWRQRVTIANPRQMVCVAHLDSNIVGFICVFAHDDSIWGSYIDNWHVEHEMHRSGIGHALMRRAGEWLCGTCPGAGVYLWVMEANTPARAFYHRLGARNVETIDKQDPGSRPR